ncbi:hypothetical protein [Glaciibacter psychrotolerans]|uniref:DUF2746 domain-containing protein n=1 Tax=Glaciibacter psychrotolerans TaxID=670054 RepID=A0A7Z0ECP0_9MICO|nr:hypothetical protein [Leifsonia psychrotolerans]NYJ19211.1 hypothetical protein [Leifsonia psychrotolerans]
MTTLTEPVQIQLVIVFGSILTAVVGTIGVIIVAMVNRTRQYAKSTQEHVQNSHMKPDGKPLNLRDDLDDKFQGLSDLVKGAISDIGGLRSDIRSIRKEALTDRQAAASDRDHLRHLEETLTPAELKVLRDDRKE